MEWILQWKPLEGIVDNGKNYEVSSNGQVRNIKTKRILKPWKVPKGYHHVRLAFKGTKDRKYGIHRLVALAFIPNPENKSHVNHIDANKINNSVENLEWVSPEENSRHANINELFKTKLTQNDVIEIKKLLLDNVSQYKIAKQFNVSRTAIANIHTGKTWNFVEVDGFVPFSYGVRGEHTKLAKLNENKVREIRHLHQTVKYSSHQLGKMYSVCPSTIQDILNGKTWSHVD